REQTGHH
ncbi:hypothetical protein E2320_000431, partial [Naja naja]